MVNKDLFVNYNDKLYWIYRKFNTGTIPDKYLNEVKEYWFCDLVLKQKTQEGYSIVFLREISDAVIV